MRIKAQLFEEYYEEIAAAEQKKDFRRMRKYLKKLESLQIETDFYQWVLNYSKTIYLLLYEPKSNRTVLNQNLLNLRSKIKEPENYLLYKMVKELYVNLLVHFLQKNYQNMSEIPEYEEMALELQELIEEEQQYTRDGKDIQAFVYGVLGSFYYHNGKIALGASYYENVWERNKNEIYISENAFTTLISFAGNKLAQGEVFFAEEVCCFLWNKLVQEQVIAQSYAPDILRLIFTYAATLETVDKKEEALELAEQVMEWETDKENGLEHLINIFGIYLYELHWQKKSCPVKYLKKIKKVFSIYKNQSDFSDIPDWRKINFYIGCHYLEKMNGTLKTSTFLDKTAQILLEKSLPEIDRMAFFSGMMNVLYEYRNLNKMQEVVRCADRMMHRLLNYYSTMEYYQENKRMEQYLIVCKMGFEIAYQSVADLKNPIELMEYSINCKNLLSTVIRFRNRLEQEELWKREKNEAEIPYYSIQEFIDKLPEHTGVIDFLCMNPEIYTDRKLTLQEELAKHEVYIFVLIKNHGKVNFKYQKIQDDTEVREYIGKFLERLKQSGGKLQKLAKKVFENSFGIFEEDLKEVQHLWICPDLYWSNVPFDIIVEFIQQKWACQDIVYWQSLRDVFETWSLEQKETACIIGSPDFEIKKHRTDINKDLSRTYFYEQISELPFSGYEAQKISEILNCPCYIGNAANKYLIREGYRYIHIATHGIMPVRTENPWYDCTLIFSGVINYMQSEKEEEPYGNGMLTAEEISRKNLSGTELVVLSACHSGSSHFSKLEQQVGLHVAFGAAGVKYIVSALWEVDDIAATIFMFYFYKNLSEGRTIFAALANARIYLRNTTVKKIKHMFDSEIQEKHKEIFRTLEAFPEDYCLYDDPKYWGSFICYSYSR